MPGIDIVDCTFVHKHLDGFIDAELGRDVSDAVATHLAGCADCSAAYAGQLRFVTQLRQELSVEPAPDVLRSRVRAALRQDATAPPPLESSPAARGRRSGQRFRALRRWMPIAAAVLLLAGGGVWFTTQSRRAEGTLASEVVASHVHSLMLDHLLDVKSTDQHTVKPWFAGKLDFAPIVPRLEEQGFPLIGGRIDHVGARQVSVIVYQRRLHVINLYAWSERHGSTGGRVEETRDGYHLISWRRGDVEYWAVSDVGWPDLRQFVSLIDREVVTEQ